MVVVWTLVALLLTVCAASEERAVEEALESVGVAQRLRAHMSQLHDSLGHAEERAREVVELFASLKTKEVLPVDSLDAFLFDQPAQSFHPQARPRSARTGDKQPAALVDVFRARDGLSIEEQDCGSHGSFQNVTLSFNECGNGSCAVSLVYCGAYRGPLDNCSVASDGSVFCGGEYAAPTLTACSVQHVLCQDASQLFYNGGRLLRMQCPGRSLLTQPVEAVRGDLEGCSVLQVLYDIRNKANVTQEMVVYDLTLGLDDGITTSVNGSVTPCTHADVDYPQHYTCVSGCALHYYDPQCVCALDYTGSQCDAPRSAYCNTTLEGPTSTCPPLGVDMGEDHCFRVEDTDTVVASIAMSCKFFDTKGLDLSMRYLDLFDYWFLDSNRSLAISYSTDTHEPTLRDAYALYAYPINFNRLSDRPSLVKVVPEAQHLAGSPLEVPIPVADVPQRVFAGGQVVVEIGTGEEEVLQWYFATLVMDVKGKGATIDVRYGTSSYVLTWVLVITVVLVLALLMLIYWIRERIERAREHRRMLKLEKGE